MSVDYEAYYRKCGLHSQADARTAFNRVEIARADGLSNEDIAERMESARYWARAARVDLARLLSLPAFMEHVRIPVEDL